MQSLLKHTEPCHTDSKALVEAHRTVHELAVIINVGGGGGLGGRVGSELIQLEALIDGLAGLQAPDRQFLSHDLVTITTAQGRKDRAFFLFTDLLVITSIKRKSTTVRKPSQYVNLYFLLLVLVIDLNIYCILPEQGGILF